MKKKTTPPVAAADPDKVFWAIIAIALLLVLYARLRLLGMPLERDEGGFAYIGQRLFGSQLLYSDMLDNKLPGLYFFYWVFTHLPIGAEKGVHLGLLLLQAGTLALFFGWVRKAFNFHVAAVATALFSSAVLMPGVLGFAAHATQLLLLPVVAGLYLLWDYLYAENRRQWWRLVLSGLCLGYAFTVKQPAIVFSAFAVGALLFGAGTTLQKFGRAIVLGMASLFPFCAMAGYFYAQGRFDDFWLWTYTLPAAQTLDASDAQKFLSQMLPKVVGNNWLFWGLGILSLAILPISSFGKAARYWAVGLLGLSFCSTAIGLGFMPHYFVPVVPFAALGVAASLYWAATKYGGGGKRLFAVLGGILVFLPMLMNFSYFFKPNYLEILERHYHWNGFGEAKAVSAELKKRLKPGERVAVLGSEPEINFYTNTDHCSPHLYLYPVLREHQLTKQYQQQYLRDILSCNAEYVVLTASEASWAPGFGELPFFKRDIFPKITERYTLIGRANIGQIPLNMAWDEALKTHNPPKCPPMFVFKRKQ